MVQTLSAGVDGLDFESLPKNVEVFSNAGAFSESVAEHAWGLLLGVAKGLHARNKKTTPRKLRGKTLLVVGCGAIGSEVARLSKSLNMRTVGVSRSFRIPGYFDERRSMAELSSEVANADAIVVALPITKSTRAIINHDILKRAKDTAILVDVGRGETVSEEGVIKWLSERPESRFATDVYWFKDGKESFATRAWDLANFTGTLHTSGLPLGEDLEEQEAAAARNVKEFFENGTPVNRIEVSEYL